MPNNSVTFIYVITSPGQSSKAIKWPAQQSNGYYGIIVAVGRRGTNQLCLLEWNLDVLVKHTTEIPPPTALVEGTAPSALVEGVSLR